MGEFLEGLLRPSWVRTMLLGFAGVQDALLVVQRQMRNIEMDYQTLQAKADALLNKIEGQTNAFEAVKALVEGQRQQLIDIKGELASALANQGQPDEAKLQALSDTLDKIIEKTDAEDAATAALLNTPADTGAQDSASPPVGDGAGAPPEGQGADVVPDTGPQTSPGAVTP